MNLPLVIWLQALRDLLADPKRWTTHTYGRDAFGKAIAATDRGAVAFCLFGGVQRVAWDLTPEGPSDVRSVEKRYEAMVRMMMLMRRALDARVGTGRDSLSFNDYHDTAHADVLALIDGALDLARTSSDYEGRLIGGVR